MLGIDVNVPLFGAVKEPSSGKSIIREIEPDLACTARVVVTSTNDRPLRYDILTMLVLGSELEFIVAWFEKLRGLLDMADSKGVPDPVDPVVWRKHDVVLAWRGFRVVYVDKDLLRDWVVGELHVALLFAFLLVVH